MVARAGGIVGWLAAGIAVVGCAAPPVTRPVRAEEPSAVLVANLGRPSHARGLREIRAAFRQANPGYDVSYYGRARGVPAGATGRVVFVQEESAGTQTFGGAVDGVHSPIGGGDILLLRPDHALTTDAALDFLVFDVPEPFPAELPTFIRPDWDERITDTPGGCATETGAYRRILLTWLSSNGPYVYHALNAHRVRITDSFSHYHPLDGGFDEFYFVQMVQPGGRLIVSGRTEAIESPETVTAEEASSLLETHRLEVGDLVYIPRGVVHRGLGGVLAQVITVPGFRPGAEIGVDHHLRAINESLLLDGDDALPYNEAASDPTPPGRK